MRNVHVLTRKEEIDPHKIANCTAVIIDVLLATTTIAAALHHGFSSVIPALDEEEALHISRLMPRGSFLLAGEKDGFPFPGFCDPDPVSLLRHDQTGKVLIYATTNGTVAVRNSMQAKEVYTSSIANGLAVAKYLAAQTHNQSILIICAGSNARFSLEDFIGAGYLIAELERYNSQNWMLSDSAKAARDVFGQHSQNLEVSLAGSATGSLLRRLGYSASIPFASQLGFLPVIPALAGKSLIDSKNVSVN